MRKGKFCFLCGKPAVKEGLCKEHWGEKNPLIKLPKEIKFVQCPKCDLIKFGNKHVEPDFEKMIKSKAKLLGEVDEWEMEPRDDGFEVHVSGWIGKTRKEERHMVKMKAVKNVCGICGRLLGGYYEAKLQIRGNFSGVILEHVERQAANIRKRDKKAFIRHELLKEGVDFYFGSKSAARKIATSLRKNFGAELKETFKVVGRKDGKDIKRIFIAVRFKGKFKPVPNV